MQIPMFAKPESVFTLKHLAAFIALLDRFNVPYYTWHDSQGKIAELWKEIVAGDAVYTTGALFGRPDLLVRFIITLVMRVVVDHPGHGLMVLVELIRDGGWYLPRGTEPTVSEKTILRPDGTPRESPEETGSRCLLQENGIRVSPETLKQGLTFWPVTSWHPLVGGAQYIEQDMHEKVGPEYKPDKPQTWKPGLWHFNQVARYIVRLPEDCYFGGLRVDMDHKHKYLSRWVSMHEESKALDRFPADLVLPKGSIA